MDTITDLLKVECVCSAADALVQPVQLMDAIFLRIFGYGCINQNENRGNPLNCNYTKYVKQ